jgi:type II secretory ATPase GspE/PulE/Tfp pilus assembly ATPase PilB-like protein
MARGGGIVVLASPPRSGATVAYRAVLERAARIGGSILSLESPLQAPLDGVAQLELERSSRARLSELIRPAPDWLGIDAPPSPALSALAVDAAHAGSTAILTVPAPSTQAALLRLEATGLPASLLRERVACALARRVVPRICPSCRVTRQPNPSPSQRCDDDPASLSDLRPWTGIGCPACADQGTRGRLALAELTVPSGPCGPTLAEQARDLLRAGEVTLEAVGDLIS